MRTLREVFQELGGSPETTGLTPEAVALSRQKHGGNRLTPLPREPLWKKFLAKFDEPIIKILLAAALLSMAVDLFGAGEGSPEAATGSGHHLAGGIALAAIIVALAVAYVARRAHWIPSLLFLGALILWPIGVASGHASYDGLAVMIAVILATGVAFLSEYRSDREFEVLNAQKESLVVKVLRGGAFHTIPLEEVVVGDVVVLEMGDEIPADGRLLKATELFVDQSLMTGESEPVRKDPQPPDETVHGPDQPGCLYRGTQVVDGVGQMLVIDVGDATYLGQIARRLATAEHDGEEEADGAGTEEERVQRKLTISKQATPLQQKLADLADLISKVGYVAAAAIFLALLGRGIAVGAIHWPGSGGDALKVARELLDYFMYMVIIIVVAVPEGLPMSVTVSLALAMQKMTRANSLVRQLVACETIGSTTIICTDKTGTLTQNKMQVVRVAWGDQVFERGTPGWALPDAARPWPHGQQPPDWMVLNAAVNSTANLEEKDGKLLPVGNSTEGALLQWLNEAGISYLDVRQRFPELYQVHFSSERKRMTTVVRYDDRLVALVKGAPEWVLAHSTHYQTSDGTIEAWTPAKRAAVQERLDATAARAMRTLALAHVLLPPGTPEEEEALHARRETLEEGLVFTGFIAIRDPLREDVKAALDECRRAGIQVMMITGDNEETARAIGTEVGLLDEPEAMVLTSEKFNSWDDRYLGERLPHIRILARARPLDKYRMVKLLQERDHVVAVTGDGTNDAPALKRADVGLAMGRTGTEVAKEASKIVLLDDAFSTIVKAVHWGRALYENIQRFIQFQLTINASALVIAFLGPLVGVKPPFTVLQLLWINVIMDTLASIALCSEPPRPGLMRLPPKRRGESILTRRMLWTIATTGAFFVIVMMTLLLGMEYGKWLAGAEPESPDFPGFTVRQVTVFFTVYIFFQVWNEINCRSLVPEVSGFSRLWRNRTFLTVMGLIVVGQVVIVTFGNDVFKVEPLAPLDWLVIAAATASVLVFSEITRRVRLFAGK
jgi:P-type Ca2+ transporter type 2C